MSKKIVVASDHAGFPIKNHIVNYLNKQNIEVIDLGPQSEDSVDYSDFGHKLAEKIENGEAELGIALCGSGNGMNMTTNKHQKIRSALCWNDEISLLARLHNDANVCVLPGRYVTQNQAEAIVEAFLKTSFEGGRHLARINKIPL